MSNVLASVNNPALVSRHDHLALLVAVIINATVHAAGEILPRGTLLGKIVSTGKYRAYAEATVKSGGAFGTGAATFTADVDASPLAKHLRVGDAIESTAGVALGTIATYDPVTGVGTLTGNSAAALTAGNKFRVTLASLALASNAGKILANEVKSVGDDIAEAGYFSGFFVADQTTVTAAAQTALGGITIDTNELWLK